MKFDMKDLNPGIWVDIDEDDPDQGALCLRPANGEALRKIKAKTEKKATKFRRGQILDASEVDEEKADLMLWDYCISDWRGILDADGNPIECTAENKLRLMRGSPVFAGLISAKFDEIRLAADQRAEDTAKN